MSQSQVGTFMQCNDWVPGLVDKARSRHEKLIHSDGLQPPAKRKWLEGVGHNLTSMP